MTHKPKDVFTGLCSRKPTTLVVGAVTLPTYIMGELMSNDQVVSKYKKHTSNEKSPYYIDEKYMAEILADIGCIFAKDIADDRPYDLVDMFKHITWCICDLSTIQKIYLAFRLGEQFGHDLDSFETMIMLPFIAREEKRSSK